jgi:hypothetical protein
MPFVPFHDFFPDLAERETRSVNLLEEADGLSAGDYALMEMYCDERRCDCRRVFFMVVSRTKQKPLAYISFGWESADYYAKWMKGADPQTLREAVGVALNRLSPQSKYAPRLLELVRDVVLRDPAYVERLKTHYQMVRREVDGISFRPDDPAARKQRKRERAKILAQRERQRLGRRHR